jgi:hypothetical protein
MLQESTIRERARTCQSHGSINKFPQFFFCGMHLPARGTMLNGTCIYGQQAYGQPPHRDRHIAGRRLPRSLTDRSRSPQTPLPKTAWFGVTISAELIAHCSLLRARAWPPHGGMAATRGGRRAARSSTECRWARPRWPATITQRDRARATAIRAALAGGGERRFAAS